MSKSKSSQPFTPSWEDADEHGECPICGKYKSKIKRGLLKPCFMWERVGGKKNDHNDNDTE